MDIEQLKLILEHVNTLGAEAKPVLIMWILLEYVPPLLGFLALMATAAFGVHRAYAYYLRSLEPTAYTEVEKLLYTSRSVWLSDLLGTRDENGKNPSYVQYEAVKAACEPWLVEYKRRHRK
jgi:hypothetical protein